MGGHTVQYDACFEHGKLWANCTDCRACTRSHYTNVQSRALDVDTGEDAIRDAEENHGDRSDQLKPDEFDATFGTGHNLMNFDLLEDAALSRNDEA